MVDRQARDGLYDLMVRFLRGEQLVPDAVFGKLETRDGAVHEIRHQFGDHFGQGQSLYRSPVVADWFFRCLLYLRTDLDYEWPSHKPRITSGCLMIAAPVIAFGTLIAFVLKSQLWWLWLAILVAAFAVYVAAGKQQQARQRNATSQHEAAVWPFAIAADYEKAAAEHQDRLRRDAPSLFGVAAKESQG